MADQPVTTEEYRDALRRLLFAWKRQTASGVEVRSDRVRVLALVYSWVAQVHRFGHGFILLEKRGFSHEAHPLVRSALEHTLMAHWVSITGDPTVTSWYAEDHRLLESLLDEAKGRPRDVASSRP